MCVCQSVIGHLHFYLEFWKVPFVHFPKKGEFWAPFPKKTEKNAFLRGKNDLFLVVLTVFLQKKGSFDHIFSKFRVSEKLGVCI